MVEQGEGGREERREVKRREGVIKGEGERGKRETGEGEKKEGVGEVERWRKGKG